MRNGGKVVLGVIRFPSPDRIPGAYRRGEPTALKALVRGLATPRCGRIDRLSGVPASCGVTEMERAFNVEAHRGAGDRFASAHRGDAP